MIHQDRKENLNKFICTISHGILDPAMSRGGVESTPPLENTLGGVRDQLCFYRIMNLYKIRQNPKNQTPSFENGALKNFSNSNFFALSEMRKNMVPGENLRHSLKFLPFDL